MEFYLCWGTARFDTWPLLFLLYINDIVNEIGSNIRLFADDTSLFVIVENPDTAARLINDAMNKSILWA